MPQDRERLGSPPHVHDLRQGRLPRLVAEPPRPPMQAEHIRSFARSVLNQPVLHRRSRLAFTAVVAVTQGSRRRGTARAPAARTAAESVAMSYAP
jgi:hypothetical protein